MESIGMGKSKLDFLKEHGSSIVEKVVKAGVVKEIPMSKDMEEFFENRTKSIIEQCSIDLHNSIHSKIITVQN